MIMDIWEGGTKAGTVPSVWNGVVRWARCHLHRNGVIISAWEGGAKVGTVPFVQE